MEGYLILNWEKYSSQQLIQRSAAFREQMVSRRSVREFSDTEVPEEVIKNIIMTAANAPSGANKQPWTFCAVSNPTIKHKIRLAAEKEEYLNYTERMSEEWLADLKQFGTNWQKPFITTAPWLIVVFRKPYDMIDGAQHKNYYVQESVGIACGFLISAIHMAGLVTLTHTPSPMNFLSDILKRPPEEKAFLLLPVGYAADDIKVPDIKKKSPEDVMFLYK